MANETGRPQVFLPLIQREIRLLVILSIVAAALFVATRVLARWVRDINAQTAAEFFDRGQRRAASGDLDRAVAAFRRAVAANRARPDYALALARTLVARGGRDEARRLLLRQRDARPDDVEINYWLARIAAADGSLSEATRYYNHAMYGLGDSARNRFDLRAELIGLLLEGGETEQARAELAALSREAPDTADAHLRTASLAERAGNARLALAEYSRVAALDRAGGAAFAGAGRMALQLHDFAAAERDFEAALRLGVRDDATLTLLARVRLVRSTDPLAPRLPLRERIRRVTAGAAWAIGRLSACAHEIPEQASPSGAALRADLEHAARGQRMSDADAVASIVGRIVQAVTTTSGCHVADPAVEAWQLIGGAHPEIGS